MKKKLLILLGICLAVGVAYFLTRSPELSLARSESISTQTPQLASPKVLPDEDFLDGGAGSEKAIRSGKD